MEPLQRLSDASNARHPLEKRFSAHGAAVSRSSVRFAAGRGVLLEHSVEHSRTLSSKVESMIQVCPNVRTTKQNKKCVARRRGNASFFIFLSCCVSCHAQKLPRGARNADFRAYTHTSSPPRAKAFVVALAMLLTNSCHNAADTVLCTLPRLSRWRNIVAT